MEFTKLYCKKQINGLTVFCTFPNMNINDKWEMKQVNPARYENSQLRQVEQSWPNIRNDFEC